MVFSIHSDFPIIIFVGPVYTFTMLQRMHRMVTALYNQRARLHHVWRRSECQRRSAQMFRKRIAACGQYRGTFGRADAGAPDSVAKRSSPVRGGNGGGRAMGHMDWTPRLYSYCISRFFSRLPSYGRQRRFVSQDERHLGRDETG